MTDDVWCEGYSDDCQADKYRARIAELEEQVEKLHDFGASCIASGREQRTKIAALEAALADAERRPEQREIRELRAERDGLRQQLEAARFGCKALEAEVARLRRVEDVARERAGEPHSDGCRYLNQARGCTCCRYELRRELGLPMDALDAREAREQPKE